MFYVKRKNYAGRWIVRIVQAALLFGIGFYGLTYFGQWMESQKEADVVVEPVQEVQTVQVITIQREVVVEAQPELDQYDYFRLGFDHQMTGEYYDAIADYTRSIELDPSLTPSYLNRGVAYEQLGDNDYRAMVDFTNWMMRDNMLILSRAAVSESDEFLARLSEGYRYDLPLDLQDGEVISLSAISVNEDEVDPIIVLLDPNGQPVAANDDVRRTDGSLVSMNSYIGQYEVVRSGQYTLMVSHAGGGSYGDVNIRVTVDH